MCQMRKKNGKSLRKYRLVSLRGAFICIIKITHSEDIGAKTTTTTRQWTTTS